MSKWLPRGWWIDLHQYTTGDGRKYWCFTCGIGRVAERIGGQQVVRHDANREAERAIRRYVYYNLDNGWTSKRVHMRIIGERTALCGAKVRNSPDIRNAESEPCGRCEKIWQGLEDEFGGE